MKRKNYLILLTETERSMVEEVLTHYVQNPFLGSGDWVSNAGRETVRIQASDFLNTIKSFDGGIRKLVSEDNLYYLKFALNWYGNFIPPGEDMNEYTKLAYVITGRNENQHLIDFDPNAYNPKEKKEIRKKDICKDFSQIRYLIVREVKGEIDYVSEIIQKEKETESEYEKRANKELKKQEGNHTGLWMLVKNTDLPNLKIGKKCGYFAIYPSSY